MSSDRHKAKCFMETNNPTWGKNAINSEDLQMQPSTLQDKKQFQTLSSWFGKKKNTPFLKSPPNKLSLTPFQSTKLENFLPLLANTPPLMNSPALLMYKGEASGFV